MGRTAVIWPGISGRENWMVVFFGVDADMSARDPNGLSVVESTTKEDHISHSDWLKNRLPAED